MGGFAIGHTCGEIVCKNIEGKWRHSCSEGIRENLRAFGEISAQVLVEREAAESAEGFKAQRRGVAAE